MYCCIFSVSWLFCWVFSCNCCNFCWFSDRFWVNCCFSLVVSWSWVCNCCIFREFWVSFSVIWVSFSLNSVIFYWYSPICSLYPWFSDFCWRSCWSWTSWASSWAFLCWREESWRWRSWDSCLYWFDCC